MAQLAIKGGKPLVTEEWPQWPVVDGREIDLIRQVTESGNWSYNGPCETQFRKLWSEYIGTKYAVTAANGTVTLQLALEALGIGFQDEVIVPALTWQATAASVIDVNAIPVLVDVEEDTWCMDPSSFEAAITSRTKAVIPVHLYGTICNMSGIKEIADKHGFNYAFRYDRKAFCTLSVAGFRNALSAEVNFPFLDCYAPLNDCELYSPMLKKRHKISDDYFKAINPKRFELPVSTRAYQEEYVCAHHKILMGTKRIWNKSTKRSVRSRIT